MKKCGLPNYQVKTDSNRKVYKTLFIVSKQIMCIVFIDNIKILQHYSLNIQKALIRVSNQVLKKLKLLLNPMYLDIIIQYQIYGKVKPILKIC